MKEELKEMALFYRKEYLNHIEYIKTFELIFKDKRYSNKLKELAKDTLKNLYRERDEYGKQAEFYRTLYQESEGCKRVIGWGKEGIRSA